MIDFLVELADFEFRLQVHLVVINRSLAVAVFLAVLAHHDHRGLEGGQRREDEVEQNERIGVERFGEERQQVHAYPERDEYAEDDDELPASAETGDDIGHALAKRQFFFEIDFRVCRQKLMFPESLDHLLVQLGQLALLLFEQRFDIAVLEELQVVHADPAILVPASGFFLDDLRDGGPHDHRPPQLRALFRSANLAFGRMRFGSGHDGLALMVFGAQAVPVKISPESSLR